MTEEEKTAAVGALADRIRASIVMKILAIRPTLSFEQRYEVEIIAATALSDWAAGLLALAEQAEASNG